MFLKLKIEKTIKTHVIAVVDDDDWVKMRHEVLYSPEVAIDLEGVSMHVNPHCEEVEMTATVEELAVEDEDNIVPKRFLKNVAYLHFEDGEIFCDSFEMFFDRVVKREPDKVFEGETAPEQTFLFDADDKVLNLTEWYEWKVENEPSMGEAAYQFLVETKRAVIAVNEKLGTNHPIPTYRLSSWENQFDTWYELYEERMQAP